MAEWTLGQWAFVVFSWGLLLYVVFVLTPFGVMFLMLIQGIINLFNTMRR